MTKSNTNIDHHYDADIYVRVVVNGPMLIIQQWKVCLGTRGGLPRAGSIGPGRRRPSKGGGGKDASISWQMKWQDGWVGVNERSGWMGPSRKADLLNLSIRTKTLGLVSFDFCEGCRWATGIGQGIRVWKKRTSVETSVQIRSDPTIIHISVSPDKKLNFVTGGAG